jgi:hypothetical protein
LIAASSPLAADGLAEKVLDLGVDAAQIVPGPPFEFVLQVGGEADE